MEATQERQKTEAKDFATQLGRFREKTRKGHVAEASVIQLTILLDHGVWVD